MKYEIRKLDSDTTMQLVNLSKKWEEENCTWGIVANTENDLAEPVFVAEENGVIVGYALGHYYTVEQKTSYIPIGAKCFMLDEIYVLPQYRNKGIGKELFKLVEKFANNTCEYLTLSTSTKNYTSILRFYVYDLEMTFHSAFLIKEM